MCVKSNCDAPKAFRNENGSLDDGIITFVSIQTLSKNSSNKAFQPNPVKKILNHIFLELNKVFLGNRDQFPVLRGD